MKLESLRSANYNNHYVRLIATFIIIQTFIYSVIYTTLSHLNVYRDSQICVLSSSSHLRSPSRYEINPLFKTLVFLFLKYQNRRILLSLTLEKSSNSNALPNLKQPKCTYTHHRFCSNHVLAISFTKSPISSTFRSCFTFFPLRLSCNSTIPSFTALFPTTTT